MKIGILLLSILATTCAWWWIMQKNSHGAPMPFTRKLKTAAQSLLVGISVYFCLLLVALGYLMLTAR